MIYVTNFPKPFSYLSFMNENNTVLENTSLFLDLDNAISQLEDVMSHYKRHEFLMVVLCEDAMPIANEVARRLGLNLTFSAVDLNVNEAYSVDKGIPVDFDYGMVKESGRDIPQDVIIHQERNLRSDLIAMYNATYGSIRKTYPGRLIILVDQLTNINAAFFPCLSHKYSNQSEGNSFSTPAFKDFVLFHLRMEMTGKSITQGLDILVEGNFG